MTHYAFGLFLWIVVILVLFGLIALFGGGGKEGRNHRDYD